MVGIICALYLRFALRNINERKEDKELHELRHEIIIWNKTLRSLSNFSREEAIVKGVKIEFTFPPLDMNVLLVNYTKHSPIGIG